VGESAAGAALSALTQSGAVKGFFILVLSFFMKPLRTLRMTAKHLREIGAKSALEVENTNVPHLTWLGVAGNVIASVTRWL
jgi:hypothetical protein